MLARAGKYKFGARIGKYKFGDRVDNYKLGTRAGKYKLGVRTSKYKLGARAGGGGRRSGPKIRAKVGAQAKGREIQRPM